MCLAIPGKLVERVPHSSGIRMGKVDFGGIVKQICLEYTPEAEVGDYVLVHVGFALSRIDQAEAQRTYELLKEMAQLEELQIPDPIEAPASAAGSSSALPVAAANH
jgi:hydrogenase expression/formation protein HypC